MSHNEQLRPYEVVENSLDSEMLELFLASQVASLGDIKNAHRISVEKASFETSIWNAKIEYNIKIGLREILCGSNRDLSYRTAVF